MELTFGTGDEITRIVFFTIFMVSSDTKFGKVHGVIGHETGSYWDKCTRYVLAFISII